MTSEKLKKSKLALAIEQRERKTHEFEVQGFFALGDTEIQKIAIRVNTKSEDDASIVAAHRYAHSFKGEGVATARKDSDILTDGKAIEALFRACRSPKEEGAKFEYPIFPGPSWMRENLTTDQIAILLNLYQEVRRVEAPVPWEITISQVMQLSQLCAEEALNDSPDTALAAQPKEWMVQAFIILSQKFFELISKFELKDKIDEWFYPIEDEEEDAFNADVDSGFREDDSDAGGEG